VSTRISARARSSNSGRKNPTTFKKIGLSLVIGASVILSASQATAAVPCTDFVLGKLKATYPTRNFSALSGNAGTWINSAIKAAGVPAVTTRPFQGAVMVFAGSGNAKRYPSYAKYAAGRSIRSAKVWSLPTLDRVGVSPRSICRSASMPHFLASS
jgi:hypothetical protein